MKNTRHIIWILCTVALCANLYAQQKPKTVRGAKPAAQTGEKAPAKLYRPKVYMGNSEYSGGDIKRSVFDSLMAQGIRAQDSTGRRYLVLDFVLNYAERNMYEDSAGYLMVMTDLSSMQIKGDRIDAGLASSLKERIKGGDTMFIERIRLATIPPAKPDTLAGMPLKCVIIK